MATAVDKPRRNALGHFLPGECGNLAGRPPGSKNRLSEDFLAALADDFSANGAAAIAEFRVTDPGGYVKAVISLLPKALSESGEDFHQLTRDELRTYVESEARALLGPDAFAGSQPRKGRSR